MKLCIIGAFGFHMLEKTTGGQPVKTRQLYYTLSEGFGEENVSYIETYGWKKHPFKMLKDLKANAKKCDALIMLPAHNGVEVFSRLLLFFKGNKKLKLFYDVIGGWLPEKTAKSKSLSRCLKRFDGIWVETSSMMNALNSQGFRNVAVIPNFKAITPITEEECAEISKSFNEPYRVCLFSRIVKEKGVEEAIEAVRNVNKKYSKTVLELDMYGPIDEGYAEAFAEMKKNFEPFIAYKGAVKPDEGIEILKNYFALLFPTKYFTEGIPGTIIDSYAAGLPIITALWQNCGDIFKENITGWGYDFSKRELLEELLIKAVENPQAFISMRKTALNEFYRYSPESAFEILKAQFNVTGS